MDEARGQNGGLKRSVIGRSVRGAPLEIFSTRRKTGNRHLLILGGFHGDEPKSVALVRHWMKEFVESPNVNFSFVPLVNPDGYVLRKRRNARKVDLNRNFPTRNWSEFVTRRSARSRMFGGYRPGSEPETQVIIQVINRLKPACIITVHSISKGRFCNNYDGPAEMLAKAIWKCNGYPVRKSIGYPTPGSFGTWAGVEREIPTITLELPTERSMKQCWNDNRAVPDAIAPHLSRKRSSVVAFSRYGQDVGPEYG